ncbi:hypothetical protein HOG21_00645 [bacterium]|jgi:hypothetical protein|nr:hypothetical protein [bacterium]
MHYAKEFTHGKDNFLLFYEIKDDSSENIDLELIFLFKEKQLSKFFREKFKNNNYMLYPKYKKTAIFIIENGIYYTIH